MDTSATLLLSTIFPVHDGPGADPAPSDVVALDMSSLDDRGLMERVVGRDPDAFATLYRRYERPLFNFLLRVTRDRPLAEDLLQETFTRVWRAARTWDPGRGPARSWLYKVALNAARSELARKVHRAPHEPLDAGGRELADKASGEGRLAARIDEAQRAHAVARALDTLPDFMKEVVVLRCQQQLSFAEIARVTGAPEGTLKSRFHRAVAALRTRLGHDEGGGQP
jgi:RNA polymerase sigma-70 factor (ECF subfamily)